jgi:tetratricopeptide (TPR) repeat protein
MGKRINKLLFPFLFLTGVVIYAQETDNPVARADDAGETIALHRKYLDSALAVKNSDIGKSIDIIARSIALLGGQGYDREMAASLTALGEVYLYHGQNDLAIDNLEEALRLHSAPDRAILLAQAYIANARYSKAEETLRPLLGQGGLVPYKRVIVHELLGDALTGRGLLGEALSFYQQGLVIAEKNQITPKVTDLISKIADAYAGENRLQEARAYYDNSLALSSKQAPSRAVKESEKVADFHNRNRDFEEEIAQRKKSLEVLNEKPQAQNAAAAPETEDKVSKQGVAYKIANAYIAQEKYEAAIPYLKESIAEAGAGNDLQVQKDATRSLSEVYREKGEFGRALESYQDYVTLVDSVYARKEKELSDIARINREIAQKQSRITGLEQERALNRSRYDLALSEQQLIKERNKRQQYLIYSLVLGMVLLGLTTFFFYRSNRQQKLANNLLALKSLRSQMNPHFIFNALNSVNGYIARKDERTANRFLSEFSILMRAVLENSEEDFISLDRELAMLNGYLRLEHTRFPEKFDYEINVDGHLDPESFRIPPMLLQPYVENAIWHGLRYRENKGFLKINLETLPQDTLRIAIVDNGIGRQHSARVKTKHQKKQRSQAMENIRKRIGILNDMYGDAIAVKVEDLNSDGTGTRVTLTLKKKA